MARKKPVRSNLVGKKKKKQEIWGGKGSAYFVGCIKGLLKWTKPRGCTGCT